MQPNVEAQAKELAKASKVVNNAISAIDIVKSFNGQDIENWQYAKAIKTAARYYLVQAQANALQIGFIRFVTLGIFVQGFWYGSHLVNTGSKSPGDVLTCFWACLIAMQTADQLSPQFMYLEKGRTAGATLKANIIQMDRGRKITSMVGKASPENCRGDIQVHNVRLNGAQSQLYTNETQVSFSYPSRPNQLALKKATFHFCAGETTFVVGESGSGKSTLGNLLLRFYSPNSGDTLIDGYPIRTLDIDWIRNNITLVQQQSVLFNETIFKNIAFGRKDHRRVRKEEVKNAIETALLQYTIKDLPKGLDTVVGTGGNAMSGGQIQRVAIARARVRDTPILILDEATCALDHMSKTLVVDAVRKWRRGKTTIIITHDMSQVGENDFAYVLENGEIIQQGTRRTLEQFEQGPFRDRESIVEFPYGEQQRPPPLPEEQPSNLHPRKVPFQIDKADGSMLIEIQPKREHSILGTTVDDMQSRSSSRRPVSMLSPVAFPMERWARAQPSTFSDPQSNAWTPPKFLDSVDPAWIQGLNKVGTTKMTPVPGDLMTAVLHQENASKRARVTHGSRNSKFSAVATSLPWRKQKPKQVERDRQMVPLKKILMTVWPILTWKDRLILIFGFMCAATSAAATPMFAYVFAKLLATFYLVSHSQRTQQARTWSLSVLAVAVVDSVASYFMHYLLECCGQVWVDALRKKALKRILDQPKSWFDEEENNFTHLTECLDRNAEEMRNLLGRFAAPVFVAVITIYMAILWSMILSWKLTLVGLTCAPYMYLLISSFETISGRWEGRTNEAATNTNRIFSETFSNIRTVRALTLESYFHKKYFHSVRHALRIGLRRSAYAGIFFGLRDSSIPFVTTLIFYYGAVLASSHAYTVQNIFTVITMLLFSLTSATESMASIPQISSSRSTASQLLRLTRLPYKASHEYTGHIRLAHPGPINFQDTEFTYSSRSTFPVFRGLNLSLAPATSTALVGASGSGKSTIASLLLALYPPDRGTITINGISISRLHIQTLRSLIAIVPQQPTLFPGTIAENITYALPENSRTASLIEIRAAARAAGIDTFIDSLPFGYSTLIGDGGSGLSGGQAQRIAIARAVVRKPHLLILDEATSGLDQGTASGIREMIRALEQEGIGVLVITHDRRMMQACREVVVLKDGMVWERGHFQNLIWQGGELSRLMGSSQGLKEVGRF